MKKYISFGLVLLLAACGFRPLYNADMGTTSSATPAREILPSVAIGPLPDRSGVILKNALIDRFYHGPAPADPAYTLTFGKLTESLSDLDITVDEEATRRQMRLSVPYTLTATDPNSTVPTITRNVYAIASFNVLQSRFSTRVAEDNARTNALSDLARQIEQGVLLHLTYPRAPHETDLSRD